MAKAEDIKYLGSTVQSYGECGVKGKVNEAAVIPAMLYGLKTVAPTRCYYFH